MSNANTNVNTTHDGCDIEIPAALHPLVATVHRATDEPSRLIIVNSATATPRRFYRHFAKFMVNHGFDVLTYDYSGIGDSAPADIRSSTVRFSDWGQEDMKAVLDWAEDYERIYMVGHSVGGQVTGLLEDPGRIVAMATVSAQSGYWKLQGGLQKLSVFFHVHLTLPLMSVLMGYMPWGRLAGGEDLPKAAALQWSRWCRDPDYLLGDSDLPLHRYDNFNAPILAYSIDDDDWGTRESVNAMMRAYPNVERRHLVPAAHGLKSLGHFGYFRPHSSILWQDIATWFNDHP